ncbi:MAG: hypothetical protein KQH67_09905 [Bacteroidetes bacterium]|nr:hypothetical protein [Bacteroidota bacterium]
MIPIIKYSILVVFVSVITLKWQAVQAQQLPDSVFIFTGKVVSDDSLIAIPNAHIISKFNHWGTISNNEGVFKMYASANDSLLITSIGYRPLILGIEKSMVKEGEAYRVLMEADTIKINEVIIRAFWDYQTFKLIISQMEPLDFDYERINFEENLMLSLPTTGTGLSPIQALYNRFNKNERLKRKLLKIRREYNELMMQMGRPNDTVPSKPEHMQELPR